VTCGYWLTVSAVGSRTDFLAERHNSLCARVCHQFVTTRALEQCGPQLRLAAGGAGDVRAAAGEVMAVEAEVTGEVGAAESAVLLWQGATCPRCTGRASVPYPIDDGVLNESVSVSGCVPHCCLRVARSRECGRRTALALGSYWYITEHFGLGFQCHRQAREGGDSHGAAAGAFDDGTRQRRRSGHGRAAW
jgi:hypothetical protein